VEAKTTTRVAWTFGVLAALLTALLIPIVANAQTETPQQVKATCVNAGLTRPGYLKAHFWLTVLPRHTQPAGLIEWKVAAMPDSCASYRRVLFTHIRYKTSGRGWRTFHSIGVTGPVERTRKPVAWIPTYNLSEASQFTELHGKVYPEAAELSGYIEATRSPQPWGALEQVQTRMRVWVEEAKTGKVVAHKLYPVHTRFCRHP
jgi:hypothetical protein